VNVWLVIYVGTSIGGTIGPLPVTMKECQFNATLYNIEMITAAERGKFRTGEAVMPMHRIMTFDCVEGDRPEITFGGEDVT